jgi:GLPGLI family protein
MFLLFLSIASSLAAQQMQRTVAECTVTFSMKSDSADATFSSALKEGSKTVYIKANQTRTDIIGPGFTESVLYDKNSGNVTVLRQIGNNKLLSHLTNEQWKNENKRFDSGKLVVTDEKMKILGYDCNKAYLQWHDGSIYTIYYTHSIIPSVREFDYPFKDVPGFVLQYETEVGDRKITYTATKINLSPVSLSKFEVLTDGYRVLN